MKRGHNSGDDIVEEDYLVEFVKDGKVVALREMRRHELGLYRYRRYEDIDRDDSRRDAERRYQRPRIELWKPVAFAMSNGAIHFQMHFDGYDK